MAACDILLDYSWPVDTEDLVRWCSSKFVSLLADACLACFVGKEVRLTLIVYGDSKGLRDRIRGISGPLISSYGSKLKHRLKLICAIIIVMGRCGHCETCSCIGATNRSCLDSKCFQPRIGCRILAFPSSAGCASTYGSPCFSSDLLPISILKKLDLSVKMLAVG